MSCLFQIFMRPHHFYRDVVALRLGSVSRTARSVKPHVTSLHFLTSTIHIRDGLHSICICPSPDDVIFPDLMVNGPLISCDSKDGIS